MNHATQAPAREQTDGARGAAPADRFWTPFPQPDLAHAIARIDAG